MRVTVPLPRVTRLHDRADRLLLRVLLALRLYREPFGRGDREENRPGHDLATDAGGIDGAALKTALEDPALKERARKEVDDAIAKGVFGSPYFMVDGEPFWGVDRMPMLEEWVRRGGW